MSYNDLLAAKAIRSHGLPPNGLRGAALEMLSLVERHLADSEADVISCDARHNLAYAAARVAAEVVMFTEGFRPDRGAGSHAVVFAFLREVEGGRWRTEAVYFDRARKKRNLSEYEKTGLVTELEADELREQARTFSDQVREWVRQRHPDWPL